jgi:ribonuclease VapC
MKRLLVELDFNVIPVDWPMAYLCGEAHREFGKGRHRARLNYGDCFAYAAAKHLLCPLLFIGDDFIHTDIVSALQ